MALLRKVALAIGINLVAVSLSVTMPVYANEKNGDVNDDFIFYYLAIPFVLIVQGIYVLKGLVKHATPNSQEMHDCDSDRRVT